MVRDLLIVAKDRPWLYDSLRRLRASTADVEIRVDQRRGGDRRRTNRTGAERRRRDIGDTLQTTGWALIRAAERPAPSSNAGPAS